MFDELADQLRSSPEQAENFYVMVKDTVDKDVSIEEVVAEVKALTEKAQLITVGRVAERLGAVLPPVLSSAEHAQERRKRQAARLGLKAGRQRAEKRTKAKRSSDTAPKKKIGETRRTKKQVAMDNIAEILRANHKQALAAGYKPNVWGAEEFVQEVRRSVSLKVGKEENILKVMEDLHRQDYLLTPEMVGDQVRKEFDPTL